MKKLLRILIAIMLCFSCVLGLMACEDDADGDSKKGITCRGENGQLTLYKYEDDETSELDLAKAVKDAYGENAVLVGIKENAFKNNDTLKKVIVPSTVETIDGGAFADMKALQEIELPFVGQSVKADAYKNQTPDSPDKSVDNERVFGYIFGQTEYDGGAKITMSSTSYYIPATLVKVTVNPTADYEIPMYAFSGLTQVYDIVLGEKVVGIGEYAFSSCSQMESFNIPSTVKTLYKGAFSSNAKLVTINFAGDGSAWGAMTIKEDCFKGVNEYFKVLCSDNASFDKDGVAII